MFLEFITFTFHSSNIFCMILLLFFNMFLNFKEGSLLFVFNFSFFYFLSFFPLCCCLLYIFLLFSHYHPFIPNEQQVLIILETKHNSYFQIKNVLK